MAFSRIVAALIAGRQFQIFGDGLQSRDFTFVTDAVSATIGVMDGGTPSPVYNVGGGTEATLAEAVGVLEHLAGRRLDVTYADRSRGDARRTAADTTLIAHDLGWHSKVDLESGLAAQLESAASTVG